MPWPVILVALVLALLFAGLVRVLGWAPEWALLAVGAGATAAAMTLLALLFLLAAKEDRPQLWQAFTDAVKQDWQALRRWFGPRRR